MKITTRLGIASLSLASLLGCGGQTPEPTTPPTPTATDTAVGPDGQPIAAPLVAGEPTADVSPVAAPAEVVGTLRWKSPGATMSVLAGYARMPQAMVDSAARAGLSEIIEDEMADLVDPKAYSELISFDAPVDVVVAVDTKGTQPDVLMATSVGISSLRGALAAARAGTEQVAPGVWRIGTDDTWGPRCALVAAAGRAAGRLVCGDRYEHVVKLGPYIARTMAAQPDPVADVTIDLRFRGLAQKYGRLIASQARGLPLLAEQAKIGVPAFDAAVDEAAAAVAEEAAGLVDDLDTIRVELSIDAQQGARLGGQFQFANQKSWTVGTLVDGAEKAGPAPEMFWQLPKDSETVNWGLTADPARFDKLLRIVQAMVEGGLQHEGFATPADRAALAKLIRLPFGKHVASVSATGHFGRPATAAPAGNMFADLFSSSMGWTVLGINEPPAALKAYVNDLVRAYNRGPLQAALKKEMGSDAKNLPVAKVTAAPPALGPGAMAVEMKVPNLDDPLAMLNAPGDGKPKAAATVALTFHLLLMADGNRTWCAIGSDRDALTKLLLSFKGTSPGADSLGNDPRYQQFRRGAHLSGGAFTLQALIGYLKPGLTMAMQLGGASAELQQVLALIERLPHQGRTPMVMYGDAKAGARPTSSFEMRVPREALEDIGHVVFGAVQMVQQ